MASQRRLILCREGLYYALVAVAVLLGALSRQLNLLMLLGAVLLGPLFFSLIYGGLALRRFRIERRLPPNLRVDQRLFVDLSITNAHRWLSMWTIEARDTVQRQEVPQRADGKTHASVSFASVNAGETRTVSYEGYLPQRGRYVFGPLRVSTRFPLGLVRHSLAIDEPQELLVHPKLGRLTHDWARVVRQDSGGSGRMQRKGLQEADFYGLRDWRPGDNRRLIHWRTSARRGSLVVRQFDERRSQDLAVLVDLWQPERPSEHDREVVEKAVSFVATVVADACRQSGRNLNLNIIAEEPLDRTGPGSPLFFREQMDALALVTPHHQKELPASLGHALARIAPSMPTLLISTREIDWDALQRAAGQRNAQVQGRVIQFINVSNEHELARCFHA